MALTQNVEPLEAQEAEYRKPIRPTPSRFAKDIVKHAVVMLTWYPDKFGEKPSLPADRDYEPFADITKARAFYALQAEWAKTDFADNGDLIHGTILVSDTDPDALVFDKMQFIGPRAWKIDAKKVYVDEPSTIFAQTKRDGIKAKDEVKVPVKKAAAKRVPTTGAANLKKGAPKRKAPVAPNGKPRKKVANRVPAARKKITIGGFAGAK